ncbi:MAG: hypothetical protein Q8Q35_00295 [Nanoarchaeota archaeon]|nr:hypothetical protein [Nanoarchaeota archaeon]
MFHETIQKLENMTDHVEFERMMCDLLASHQYKGIDPQSPGLADGGKDALYFSEEEKTWFAFSLRKDWKVKIKEDFKKAQEKSKNIKEFVYCTNRALPALERDKIKESIQDFNIDFWDKERIRVALDTNDKRIRQIYLGIQDNTQVRNIIKNILFDAQNEAPVISRWKTLSMTTPLETIGIFEKIKDLDLNVVCETPEELEILNDLLKYFRIVRKKASEIDNYILQIIDNTITNKFVGHWYNISEYCKLRFIGKTREFAINRVNSSNVNLDVSDCDTIYNILSHDTSLIIMIKELDKNNKLLLQILEKLNGIKAFQTI